MVPQSTVIRRHRNQTQIVEQIRQILEENLYGSISIAELCRMLSFSESYIQKLFRKYTGKTIIAYYNGLKIERAKKLISEGRYTFTQISQILGYNSVHYFSRTFRSYARMSPSEYESSVKLRATL